MIEVSVTEDGFTEKGYVSSMHLVDTKISQIRETIKSRAAAALKPWDDPLT
jgi:hypothetical protein